MDKPKVAFVTPGTFPLPSPTSSSGRTRRGKNRAAPRFPHRGPYLRSNQPFARQARKVGMAAIERFPAANKQTYIRCVKRAIVKLRPDLLQVENRPRSC